MKEKGVLYIVATPLGNLEDITRRAVRILCEVDLIAAEDTRRSRKLIAHLGLRKPFVSHFAHNQEKSARVVLEKLEGGLDVALVTDAGTPGISDPGAFLVSAAREAGFRVVPVPGPSALAAAVSVSDIPCDKFYFVGFLQARKQARRKELLGLRDIEDPLIFYEAPHRLLKALEDMKEILGDRKAMLARELTKIHEEIISASLSELVGICGKRELKGEMTIIIEGGKLQKPEFNRTEIERKIKIKLFKEGLSVKGTVESLKSEYSLPHRELYRMVLSVKQGKSKKQD